MVSESNGDLNHTKSVEDSSHTLRYISMKTFIIGSRTARWQEAGIHFEGEIILDPYGTSIDSIDWNCSRLFVAYARMDGRTGLKEIKYSAALQRVLRRGRKLSELFAEGILGGIVEWEDGVPSFPDGFMTPEDICDEILEKVTFEGSLEQCKYRHWQRKILLDALTDLDNGRIDVTTRNILIQEALAELRAGNLGFPEAVFMVLTLEKIS